MRLIASVPDRCLATFIGSIHGLASAAACNTMMRPFSSFQGFFQGAKTRLAASRSACKA